MTNYREILRLKSLGLSERKIALSCSCSRNTVSRVLKKSRELDLTWPLDQAQTNATLQKKLFPKLKENNPKRQPDYDYI